MTAPPPLPLSLFPRIMKNIEGKAPSVARLIRDANEILLAKTSGGSYHLFHFVPFLVGIQHVVNALPYDYWNDFADDWIEFDPDTCEAYIEDRHALLRFVNSSAGQIKDYGEKGKIGWDLLHAQQIQPFDDPELRLGQRRVHTVALALFARVCHFVYAKQMAAGAISRRKPAQRTHR